MGTRLSHKLNQLDKSMTGQSVSLAGIIAVIRTVNTKKNNSLMAFGVLEDELGKVDLVIFPKLYKETSEIWQADKPVFVTGRIDNRDNELSIIVENVEELTKDLVANHSETVDIPRGTDKEVMLKISQILKNSPGDKTVTIVIKNGDIDKRITLPYKVNLSEDVRKKIASLL